MPVLPLSPCCHPRPLGAPACAKIALAGHEDSLRGEGRWRLGGANSSSGCVRLFLPSSCSGSAPLISQELTTGHSRESLIIPDVRYGAVNVRRYTETLELSDVIGLNWSTATRVAFNEQCKFLFQCYINKVITYEMNQHFKPNKYELLEVLNEIY